MKQGIDFKQINKEANAFYNSFNDKNPKSRRK